MAAYVIVDVDIKDPTKYEDYKKMAAPTVTAYGGRYLARGGPSRSLEGTRTPHRVVVLEFPSAERANAWWKSEEYADAKALRQSVSDTEMIVVEGT